MQCQYNLALAYHIVAHLGLDDHTYTHLSARAPGQDAFYIYPFGLCFSEVTPEKLLLVSFAGEVLQGEEYQYNRTGYIIHGEIYRARHEINAVFHVHSPAMVAVSAIKEGLMPLSQWALHFYERLGYHDYDSLALDSTQGNALVADLGRHKSLLLRNHGAITCGTTIQEALFYLYHLEQACKTQCLILAQQREVLAPSPAICQKAVQDLLSFESNLGQRDWEAWVRKLKAIKALTTA